MPLPPGHCFRIRSLDVQNGDTVYEATIWLDLESGYSEPAEVRGEDDVIPGATGQYAGVWQRDIRRLIAVGHVKGFGTDQVERAASWRAATDSLMAVMQMDDDPGLVEVDGPYLGIPSGTTRQLNARVTRVIPGPILNRMTYQGWSFELKCIDSPPEWEDGPT